MDLIQPCRKIIPNTNIGKYRYLNTYVMLVLLSHFHITEMNIKTFERNIIDRI